MMRKALVFDGQWSLSHKVPHIFGNPRLAPSSGNNPNVLDHASGC